MILYFTGSGNSKFVADMLADRLGDEEVSLNEAIRSGRAQTFSSVSPFVFVSPIHTWNLPEVVANLIERSSFEGSRLAYFVATMESDAGGADRKCKQLAERKGLDFRGFAAIRMPGNCVYLEKMPSTSQAHATISAALPHIEDVAETISRGCKLPRYARSTMSSLKSGGAMHSLYKSLIMTDRGYVTSDACTGCGRCVRACPLGNVRLGNDGRPRFAGKCCSCYACIHHCPKAAIEIKGHSEGHGTYLAPDYNAFIANSTSLTAMEKIRHTQPHPRSNPASGPPW